MRSAYWAYAASMQAANALASVALAGRMTGFRDVKSLLSIGLVSGTCYYRAELNVIEVDHGGIVEYWKLGSSLPLAVQCAKGWFGLQLAMVRMAGKRKLAAHHIKFRWTDEALLRRSFAKVCFREVVPRTGISDGERGWIEGQP